MRKKNLKNRFLSTVMAAVLALSAIPTALAANVDGTYVPGTYTGSAVGYAGDVTVAVTLAKDGENVKISDIQATGAEETPSRWTKAATILDTIKTQNGTDGLMEKLNNKEIDAVSGATISAKAIVTAAEAALSQAVSGFAGGSGSQSDPYLVSSEAGLRYVQAQVAEGNTFAGQYIRQTADITLTGE